MEACATAHFWAREIGKLGHSVRLIPPVYVKPFVKRQKNDAADAEAIAEAASGPTMRFVEPKSERQQARAMVFRTRDLLVRQRTQLTNALRAHLAEHGVVAPQGITNVAALGALIEEAGSDLDLMVVEAARLYLELMRWMPPPSGIGYTKTVLYSPSGGRINDIEDQHSGNRLSKRQLSGLCGRI